MKNKLPGRVPLQSHPDEEPTTNRWGKAVNIGLFVGLIGLTLFAFSTGILTPVSTPGAENTPSSRSASTADISTGQSVSNDNVELLPRATQALTPTTQPSPTPSMPTANPKLLPSPSKQYARISCSDKVYKVNLRRTPGHVGKDETKDVILEVDCGESVEILGENRSVDGLTWWNVRWDDYTGWMADSTVTGHTILIFEQRSFSRSSNLSDPVEFISGYFHALWKDRNYEELWNTYLTPAFRNHYNSEGIDEYSTWWDSVKQIDVHFVDVIENDGDHAWVRVQVTFYLFDDRVLDHRSYDYDLTFDREKEIWMFDYR